MRIRMPLLSNFISRIGKTKKPICKPRKRYFQLLEVMIAAFILLVCVAPAMRVFTSIFLSQQEIIRKNAQSHIVHLIHAELTQMLYKNEIPLEDLKQTTFINIQNEELLKLLHKYSYKCTGTFVMINGPTSRGAAHPNSYLGKLTIEIEDLSLKKLPKEKSNYFYTYDIYIDSGKIEKGTKKGNKGKKL